MAPYAGPPPDQNAFQVGPPQKKGLGGCGVAAIIIGVVAVLGLILVVVGGVLAVHGTRKYLLTAKQAEVRSNLKMIGMEAARAYEDRVNSMCPSASKPVPVDEKMVSGKKYVAAPSEWEFDQSKNAGFACLGFTAYGPQYYQYNYVVTGKGFSGIGRGDLNGDGVFSEFKVEGSINSAGHVTVSPTLRESNPDE